MAPKSKSAPTKSAATKATKPAAKAATKPAAKPAAKAAVKPAPAQKRKAPAAKEVAAKKNKPAAKKSKVPEKVVEAESESEEEEQEEEEESSMFAEEIAAADSSSDEGVDSSEEEEEAVESKPVAKSAPKPEEESEEEVDETELLQGIDSSEGEDSSDDEGDLESTFAKDEFTDNKPHIALDPQDEAKLKKKLEQLDQKAHTEKVDTGVIYLGRIPHGFYEDEMRAYFGQFGTVTRLRLSRNKKTGKSKHYAFIEFKSMDVAEIVAETMNNYLLYGHLLKCKVIPEDKLHPKLFDGANKKFKVIPWNKIAREEHNKPKTRESRNRVVKKLLKKEAKTRAKLQELGIDYDFPGYTGDVKPKSKRIVFDN